MDRGIWMTEKRGTEQQQKSPARVPVPQKQKQAEVISFPIVPPVPALDGSRLRGTGLDAAIARLKNKAVMPRTKPLSDAEMNEQVGARMKILEEQKRMLTAKYAKEREEPEAKS
jgi:hypothetical protein